MRPHKAHAVAVDYSRAACLDLDPEAFTGVGTREARFACHICPVRDGCLADAQAEETHGVFRGGQIFPDYGKPAPSQTGARRKRRARCGTDGGYYRHVRTLNEWPCEACKRAHAEYERKREKPVHKGETSQPGDTIERAAEVRKHDDGSDLSSLPRTNGG